MTTLQNILRYINEDFAPPTVRLILVSQNEILLNQIVSKKSTLHNILTQEGLKEENNYLLFGKPVDLDQKIIDIIPKNYSNLSNIELIIENKNILLEENKLYYEKILKPFDNPFKILVFSPNEFNLSIKSYPKESIDKLKLYKFSLSMSSYCNTPDNLYISGGPGDDYSSTNSGNKHFWKINSIKTNIEKINDLPIDKQNHSMIYIPKRYIYFIGGNNKNTFFYDIFFSTFKSWANMNKPVKNPCLILVNNIFIYSFGNPDINNTSNNFTFERTNLKSSNPKWELKVIQNQILPIRNFGGILVSDEIYFLGGRHNKGEKMFKFNITSENIGICKQENTRLKPLDKNFYELNEFNSVMIPDCNDSENIQIIIFNKKRKKHRKVLFEKSFEEIVNNDNIKYSNLDNCLIKVNDQMKIFWKEYKDNYVDRNLLKENIILLPSIKELKKGNIVFNNIEEKKIFNDENINNNILDINNIINDEDIIKNSKENINNIEKNIIINDDLNKKERNENIFKMKNQGINIIIDNNEKENINNNLNENNNNLLKEKIDSSQETLPLKEILNQEVNKKIDLKKKFNDFQPSNVEKMTNLHNNYEEVYIKNDFVSNKKNQSDIPENKKENSNITESPTLYKKKTILRQDKINPIIIQCENDENENFTQKLNNNVGKNNDVEKLKNYNTFNIEYNNEIIVSNKRQAMLSDMISSNSEIKLDNSHKGLNNRLIANVPKLNDDEKNVNNTNKEIKEETNQINDKNLKENLDKIPIEENPEENISKNDNKNEKINLETEKNKVKNIDGELIEGEMAVKQNNHLEGKKNIIDNIQEKNKYIDNIEKNIVLKQDDKKNENSGMLLSEKIIYNEKEIGNLNNFDLSKEKKYESITGIIKGVPETITIIENEKIKNKEDLNNEENKNTPQTLVSILSRNINDNIILNKNIGNKENYIIKEENIYDYMNKELELNEEDIKKNNNIEPLENEIHLPSNTSKKIIPDLNPQISSNPSINDQINDIIKNENKADIPHIEDEIEIKESKLENEFKNENINKSKNDKKEEIIKGMIPGISINTNKNKKEPVEDEKELKLSINEKESPNIKEENLIKLKKEKDKSIFESITGSIIGVPKQKYLVEYGSSKGYRRPNIIKGKDFIHNPEIIIEGTIKGNKNDKIIPSTLKSIFEDNINNEIMLTNNNFLKPSEYILSKFDIPEYFTKENELNISKGSLKFDHPSLQIENRDKDDINPNKLDNLNKEIKSDLETKIKLNKNDINIKNPEIELKNPNGGLKVEKLNENIGIVIPQINIDLEGESSKGINLKNKSIEETINEGIMEISHKNKDNMINFNNPNTTDKENIPEIKGNFFINENKEILNLTNLPINTKINNIKPKIDKKEGDISRKKEEMKTTIQINPPDLMTKLNDENSKIPDDNIKVGLIKENEGQIFENITGSIVGVPEQKKLVEYLSSKGYERPNIKKGKDFIHNPEILNEGTIGRNNNRIIPSTLKSIFEDKIATNIQLNKSNIKPEIKLEDYIEKNLSYKQPLKSIINLDVKSTVNNPNIKDDKLDLDIAMNNINKREFGNPNKKIIEDEFIEGIIPGIKNNNSKDYDDKLKKKMNQPQIGGSINLNIANPKESINKDDNQVINKAANINAKAHNLKKKEKESQIFENITGSIMGVGKKKNIVEYGSTIGYKRPNIKKGKDFVHNPEILIEGKIVGKKSIKNIPLTLKSIFEDKINTNIQLNKKINDKYKIKKEDLDYLINSKPSETKINSPELKLGDINLNKPELKGKGELLKGKIKSIEINLKNKDSLNKDLKNNSIKTEIISGTIVGKTQINPKENENMIKNKGTVVSIKSRPMIKQNEEKKDIKSENIPGNIEITQSQKSIVEYGSSKGYKRPNIKKGKDFIHNPEIIIEGTIGGNKSIKDIKNIPPTLKTLFEGNINDSIILNNDSIKVQKVKIKEEEMPNFSSFNKNNNNLELEPNLNTLLKGSKINNDKEKGKKEIIFENITGSIQGIPKQRYLVEYGATQGYKRPNIKKGKDFNHKSEFIIQGIIEGKKTIESNKEEKIENMDNNKNTKIQIKRSDKLNFIEYGATLNYVKPNIKKGIDFYHEPKAVFSIDDKDSSFELHKISKEKISFEKK